MFRRFPLLTLVATAAIGLAACSAGNQEAGYLSKSVTEVSQQATAKATLIDVREPYEFASGHLPGATNIPLGDVATWAAGQPKDKPVVVVCQSGRRSAKASAYLVEQGFKQVTNVEGGTAAWIQQGLPVER